MSPAPTPADVIRLIHRLSDLADRLWDVFGKVVDAHERARLDRLGERGEQRPSPIDERDPF